MNIKFAGGFLPYIYKLNPNAFEGTSRIGSQQAFKVTVKNESVALLKHEEHHIKQMYFSLFGFFAFCYASIYFVQPLLVIPSIIIALKDYIPYVNFRKEASAYAVSVKYGRDLESAVSALSNHRYAKGNKVVAYNAINKPGFLGLF